MIKSQWQCQCCPIKYRWIVGRMAKMWTPLGDTQYTLVCVIRHRNVPVVELKNDLYLSIILIEHVLR